MPQPFCSRFYYGNEGEFIRNFLTWLIAFFIPDGNAVNDFQIGVFLIRVFRVIRGEFGANNPILLARRASEENPQVM